MPHDDPLARSILQTLNLKAATLTPLGSGFASEVWRVRHDGTSYALRVARPEADWPNTYRIEHAVMDRLTAVEAPVPRPVAGDWQQADRELPAFSLTTLIAGAPLTLDAVGWAASPIAGFLRQMHSIRVPGFGPLVEVEGRLAGQESTAEAGVRAWWGSELWPFSSPSLGMHPALRDRSRLAAQVEAHGGTILALVGDHPAVLVHSDLHDENILQTRHRLGFIDFGETFAGSARWEFAALAYFLGWDLAEATLAAYLQDAVDVDRWRPEVAALGLSFGTGRWQQDRRLGIENEAHNETFLRESLDRIA